LRAYVAVLESASFSEAGKPCIVAGALSGLIKELGAASGPAC